MFSSMAGIDTDGVGFKRIIIRPRPGGGGITATQATYHSIHGPISTDWRLKNGKYVLDVAIPANTTAIVYIPTDNPGGITESGRPASDSSGVNFVKTEGNDAVFTIDSGKYRFESRFSRTP
ncbi:MAG: hypothetical protein GY940_44065 [bacterium]|nr:hypothetical protein [bacterium]